MKFSLFICMLMLAIGSGCAIRNAMQIDLTDEKISQIKIGETTKEQVVTLFGKSTSETIFYSNHNKCSNPWTLTSYSSVKSDIFFYTQNKFIAITYGADNVVCDMVISSSNKPPSWQGKSDYYKRR